MRRMASCAAPLVAALLRAGPALAAGDLSRQDPVEVVSDPHYFTSHAFTQLIYTRKVQVVQNVDGKPRTLAEFKGAIREIEVYPGQTAEWWFVPVARGRADDLRCGIVGTDGKAHAAHGMVGEIVID